MLDAISSWSTYRIHKIPQWQVWTSLSKQAVALRRGFKIVYVINLSGELSTVDDQHQYGQRRPPICCSGSSVCAILSLTLLVYLALGWFICHLIPWSSANSQMVSWFKSRRLSTSSLVASRKLLPSSHWMVFGFPLLEMNLLRTLIIIQFFRQFKMNCSNN